MIGSKDSPFLFIRMHAFQFQIDLANRYKDFPKTWHKVRGKQAYKNSVIFKESSDFVEFFQKVVRNGVFGPKSKFI